MSFKRSISPRKILEDKKLDSALAGIGFNLAHKSKKKNANIEDSLLSASIEAVNKNDGRIAGLLVDWVSMHYERINADRLTLIVTSLDDENFKWVKLFWCANAQRLKKDTRFKRLANLFKPNKRYDFIDRNIESRDEASTDFLIKRNGEDGRFKNTCIRIPNKIFEQRPNQILSTRAIAKRHPAFKHRVIFGPSYRADMWAALERDRDLTAAKLAEITYGSYSTAHQAKHDYSILEIRDSKGHPKKGCYCLR